MEVSTEVVNEKALTVKINFVFFNGLGIKNKVFILRSEGRKDDFGVVFLGRGFELVERNDNLF